MRKVRPASVVLAIALSCSVIAGQPAFGAEATPAEGAAASPRAVAATLDHPWGARPYALASYSAATGQPSLEAGSVRPNPALASLLTVGLSWFPMGVMLGYAYGGNPGRGALVGVGQLLALIGGAGVGLAIGLNEANAKPHTNGDLTGLEWIFLGPLIADAVYTVGAGVGAYYTALESNPR